MSRRWRLGVFVLVFGLLLIAGGVVYFTVFAAPQYSYPRALSLDGQTIRVAVADTSASRELGLGGRPGLAPDEGMLFVFPADGYFEFWMKDMRFSIDILWLADNGRVVYIVPDLSPDTYPQAFGPGAKARYVLELPAGYAAAHGVKVGDIAGMPQGLEAAPN